MTHTKEVTIVPYEYFGLESGFKPKQVWIIKGDEYPDPAHKMFWGRSEEGFFPGDYKGHFTRNGKPITINYDITKCISAREEDEAKLKAIDKYIKKHEKQRLKA